MKTYLFKIVIEQDEEANGTPAGWHVYCPALQKQGAATWGETEEEAIKNIKEVLEMTLESMKEHGEEIPLNTNGEIQVLEDSRVAVTV